MCNRQEALQKSQNQKPAVWARSRSTAVSRGCRGGRALSDVLRIGMDAIAAHVYPGLKEVHMVGFQGQEKKVLCRCLQERKERHGNESKRQREEQSEAAPPSHAAKTPKSAAPRQSKLKLNRGSPKKAARPRFTPPSLPYLPCSSLPRPRCQPLVLRQPRVLVHRPCLLQWSQPRVLR